MTGRTMAMLLLAGAAAAEPAPVEFIAPEGIEVAAVTGAQKARVRALIRGRLELLAGLTGRKPRPVRVVVFKHAWQFVQRTGLPQHIVGVTIRRAILLQPLEVLDRNHALDRVVAHEAVHQFFFGRRWPDAFHEAVAHRFSGGPAVRSARAGPLAAGRTSGRDEMEWLDHLAWELDCLIAPWGEKAFFKKLFAGELDLAPFAGEGAPPDEPAE